MEEPKLTDVRGIGLKTANGLSALGIDSIRALTVASVEVIATLPGFSVNRALQVKTAAADLAAATTATPEPAERPKVTMPVPAKKTAKKKSKKKKRSSTKKARTAAVEKKKKKKKSGKGKNKTAKKPMEKKAGKTGKKGRKADAKKKSAKKKKKKKSA